MLFNSFTFLIFFLTFYIIYWLLNNYKTKYRNIFIFISSYVFYGWWDWRFLFLIFFSSILDYFCGYSIGASKNGLNRKLFLALSLVINLGSLFFFKYYNFFIDSLESGLIKLGVNIITINGLYLDIILPVGISFYTFQTLSYSLDVYYQRMKPSNNFINFLAFVSFFPQLVAGPIERASNLLDQFETKKKFIYDNSLLGLKFILWGLFKKLVIADNLAVAVDYSYDNYQDLSGLANVLGAIFFSFQIYCDFSGYSDMAIGLSKLLGFELMQNFNYPYFSKSINEFWSRWHISLSTWFRDYVYIPLGGNKLGFNIQIRNIFIVFILSGIWHGANWTFVIWGGLNFIYYLIELLVKWKTLRIPNFLKISTIFVFTTIAWIFFRSPNYYTALNFIESFQNPASFSFFESKGLVVSNIVLLIFFIFIEFKGKNEIIPINSFFRKKYLNYALYIFLVIIIILFYNSEETPFIYFQF